MENDREFKGVWIPRSIWLDTRLSMLEKGILTEIDSLDNEEGCSAGNEYLAEFCQCSETKVSLAIRKLIELGYIYVESFNGRVRILKSRVSESERQTLTKLKADIKKVKAINIDNNIDNIEKEIKKKKGFTPPTLVEVREYAKEKGYAYLANKFYDYFTTGDWVDSKGQKVKNWKQKFITWATYTSKPTFGNQRGYTAKEMDELIQNIDDIEI